jgi:O-antigen/teichoic acid export membrane protein
MTIKYNIIANYLGRGWNALLSLALIPLYIKYLGVQAYGLVGFFAVMQSWLALLDMGMTPVLSREIARFTAGVRDTESFRDLLRTIETTAALIALIISSVFICYSDMLATKWFKANDLSIQEVSRALWIMGVIASLNSFEGIYKSVLIGMQRQVLYNSIFIIISSIRGFGTLYILIYISPTINAFFIYQAVISFLSIFIYLYIVYDLLPKSNRRARFSFKEINDVWRYSSGIMAITITSIMLSQVDQIILTRILSFAEMGTYSIVVTISSYLYLLMNPILTAYFPKFTHMVSEKDFTGLKLKYHEATQMICVTTMSASAILFFFAEDILYLWIRDSTLASSAYSILRLKLVSIIFIIFLYPVRDLQFAFGWTKLTFIVNASLVPIILPASYYFTSRFYITGAISVQIITHAIYFLIIPYFMHKKILINEKYKWYLFDIFIPFITIFSTVGLFYLLFATPGNILGKIVYILFVYLISISIGVLSGNKLRFKATEILFSFRR